MGIDLTWSSLQNGLSALYTLNAAKSRKSPKVVVVCDSSSNDDTTTESDSDDIPLSKRTGNKKVVNKKPKATLSEKQYTDEITTLKKRLAEAESKNRREPRTPSMPTLSVVRPATHSQEERVELLPRMSEISGMTDLMRHFATTQAEAQASMIERLLTKMGEENKAILTMQMEENKAFRQDMMEMRKERNSETQALLYALMSVRAPQVFVFRLFLCSSFSHVFVLSLFRPPRLPLFPVRPPLGRYNHKSQSF